MERILIQSGGIELSAEPDDSETAGAIAKSLLLSGTVNAWGDEICFSVGKEGAS